MHTSFRITSLAALATLLCAPHAALAARQPNVVSGQASEITATSAKLGGTARANRDVTTVWFDFGPGSSYTSTLAATPGSIPAGNATVTVTGLATGLTCGTTYRFRVHARNRFGESTGADRVFTTSPCASTVAPTATTNGASGVSANAATLNGGVVAGSANASASFEWGTTTAYGATAVATPSSVAASTSASVSATISGLACGTAYHFRAKASSSAGTGVGANQVFNTAACSPPVTAPTATTAAASATADGASLGGSVVPGSATATVTFEWGTTTAYGNAIAASPATLAASTAASAVTGTLSGLACATTYQYRVKATSSAGTGSGANQSFTTSACGGGGSGSLRVSVGGFGQVTSDVGGISCGSVPSGAAGSSSKCFAPSVAGTVTLTATPLNAGFVFAGWAGDTACGGNVCSVPASGAKWVRARFVPASGTNTCTALGLVGDKTNRPLNGSFPALAPGQSFVDPNFGTSIRRISRVAADPRGGTALRPMYSTVSAWNADESLLILYRVGGQDGHELYDGKTYAFIRALDDLPYADIEQVYWDTTRPNIIYAASGRTLQRYDVLAPAGQRLTTLRDFTSQCGTKQLSGGNDPFFQAWNSGLFGMACVAGGVMFGYDALANVLGTPSAATEPRADSYASPQASSSGRRLFLNVPNAGRYQVRLFDRNFGRGAFLDQDNGYDHASTNMRWNGNDTYNAVQYDPPPGGTGYGILVQWNMDATPDGSNRILGRVLVGQSNGYPYPPGDVHIGGTSFNRTGLLGVSVMGSGTGATLLHDELLLVDSDPDTNSGNAICRVGHHRSNSSNYWAEPHATISPSGTRILFASSWGDSRASPIVDSFVVELPGYRP
jgi:hypothetical protein